MNIDQLNAIKEARHTARTSRPMVSATDLSDQSDRTLLYGYNCQRETFHVYLADGLIHRLIYSSANPCISYERGPSLEASLLAPDKRAYSERCDADFIALMDRQGLDDKISLLPFNEETYAKTKDNQFHGKTF